MSMIGLFTAAPQATGAKATAGDAKAAIGFGSTLKGALDALAQHAENTEASQTETAAAALSLTELVEEPTGNAQPASMTPLVELAPTPAVAGDPAESVVRAVGSETAMADTEPASTGSASDTGVSTDLLVELVETALGDSTPASPDSSIEPPPAVAGDPAEPLVRPAGSETSIGNAPSASAGPASVAAAAQSPQAPLTEALKGKPTSPSTSAPTSVGTPTPATPVDDSAIDPKAAVPLHPAQGAAGASVAAVPQAAQAPAVETIAGRPGGASPAAVPQATAVPAGVSSEASVAPQPVAVPATAAVTPTQAAAPATPVAAPAPPAAPFASQLARPIFSLAAAGAGDHVMTVSVTPDNLGPVTVRAHVGAEGVRVELFAPNDLGRDAIRAIIPELRRDLAGAGLGGNLSLSSQNQPSSEGSTQGSQAGQPGDRDAQRGTSRQASASTDESLGSTEPETQQPRLFGTTSTIDVLA